MESVGIKTEEDKANRVTLSKCTVTPRGPILAVFATPVKR